MAGGMDLGGGGGRGSKRPLDTAINLVPFIDLMAVTIVFLIMTAVWTQLGRLQVSAGGEGTGPATEPPLVLLITERDLTLTVGGVPQGDPMPVVLNQGRLDVTRLVEQLGRLRAADPAQSSITLQADDGVRYDVLIRVMDACVGARFTAVSVST